MQKHFVGYYRLSLMKRDGTGYGLDAQRHAVKNFISTGNARLIGEFQEIESGTLRTRPQLDAAIALCRQTGATLVLARLDRLARNTSFVLNLRDSGLPFVALDCPH